MSIVQVKMCSACGEVKCCDQFNKNKRQFDGLQNQCKPCAKDARNRYNKSGKGKENKAKCNRKRINGSKENNLIYRLRSRTYAVLNGRSKNATSTELLGMHPVDVIAYLNDNDKGYKFGDEGIDVDHIIPCNAFKVYGDLEDPFFQKMMCNYRNLQLMPRSENSRKKDRCDFETFYSFLCEFRSETGLTFEL